MFQGLKSFLFGSNELETNSSPKDRLTLRFLEPNESATGIFEGEELDILINKPVEEVVSKLSSKGPIEVIIEGIGHGYHQKTALITQKMVSQGLVTEESIEFHFGEGGKKLLLEENSMKRRFGPEKY